MVIASYSKRRAIAILLGPIVALVLLYILLSPYSLDYLLSRENFERHGPIGMVAVLAWLGMIFYQLITILILNKEFISIDENTLFVGYSNKGSIRLFKPEDAIVKEGLLGDRVILPRSDGSNLTLHTGMANVSGNQLVRLIANARERQD